MKRQVVNVDDSAIIGLFWDRSEKAITELDSKYGRLCRRIAKNHLSDERDIQECVNDSLLAVWNSIPPQRPDSLMAFLCRIVRNIAIDKYRQGKKTAERTNYDVSMEELDELEDMPSLLVKGTEEEALEDEIYSHVNEFLQKLDKMSRMLFVRRFWYCDSYKDISKMTGISENSLKTRFFRIKGQLKTFLQEKGVGI